MEDILDQDLKNQNTKFYRRPSQTVSNPMNQYVQFLMMEQLAESIRDGQDDDDQGDFFPGFPIYPGGFIPGFNHLNPYRDLNGPFGSIYGQQMSVLPPPPPPRATKRPIYFRPTKQTTTPKTTTTTTTTTTSTTIS